MISTLQFPLAQGLGWALMHFLWQGALIALALTMALPLFRTSRTRYGAACTSMLAMAAAFVATWAQSIPGRNAPPPGTFIGTAAANSSVLEQSLPWVVPLWAAGALMIGLYRVGGWIIVQRMRRVGVRAASSAWQDRLLRLAERMGLSQPLVLLESRLADGPMVVGLLRPAILFPVGLLSGMPVSQLEAILLHELAHIRRLDYLVNMVQTLVESVLFYHPATWWVSGLMRVERENCCDDSVVEVQGNAREYAAALLTLEERRCSGQEPAPAATGGILMNRIRRLLSQPEEPRAAAGLVLSLGLLFSAFCVIAVAQQADAARAASPVDGESATTPHDEWLDQDVVYLIADEERAAFERLQSDEERERFVEQFWERRDPTPETPLNERKVQHYRRFEYADKRWTADTPGWKTDRGRLYILYGPPDEIESYPSGGQMQVPPDTGDSFSSTDPFEEWRYRRIDGIGDDVRALFVNVGRSGDYQLINGPTATKLE